jgi:hypothetical protein
VRIDDADDRQDEQALADLEHRHRQLANGLLLLADDALALLHEADGHGDRDAVGGGRHILASIHRVLLALRDMPDTGRERRRVP